MHEVVYATNVSVTGSTMALRGEMSYRMSNCKLFSPPHLSRKATKGTYLILPERRNGVKRVRRVHDIRADPVLREAVLMRAGYHVSETPKLRARLGIQSNEAARARNEEDDLSVPAYLYVNEVIPTRANNM